MTARWELFEDYLVKLNDQGYDAFNHAHVAETFGVRGREASLLIGSYLGEMRGKGRNLFLLHREPGTRTTSTLWVIGDKMADAQALHAAFASDVRRRVDRAVAPDLRELRGRNPAAAQMVDALLMNVESAVLMVGAILDGYTPSDLHLVEK